MARAVDEKKIADPTYEARKRSVDILQRLYAIVVSLAIAVCLRGTFVKIFGDGFHIKGEGLGGCALYYQHILRFLSFIVTVVPFFHGANRYLDDKYILSSKAAPRGALLFDFCMLFLEALGIFVLAMFARIDNNFYAVLAGILLLDIVWVLSTCVSSQEKKLPIKWWAVVNIMTLFCIFIFLWSSLWPSDVSKSWMLMAICLVRTALDYMLVWRFYYPGPEIPAPLPAHPTEV